MPIKISNNPISDYLYRNLLEKDECYLHPTVDSTLQISWQVCDRDGNVIDTLADKNIDMTINPTLLYRFINMLK